MCRIATNEKKVLSKISKNTFKPMWYVFSSIKVPIVMVSVLVSQLGMLIYLWICLCIGNHMLD